MRPTLSVIIPFYNVDRFLAECLRSVASQTFSDLEVIMVDDGSTDTSWSVADRFHHSDHRFTLIRQPNRGLGPSRNTGLSHCSGRYLAFIDSDDVLPPTAFTGLVAALDESGSDLACGGVRRFNRYGDWPSGLHEGIFDKDVPRTHITMRTDLIRDRTVWNKVYRRTFWDRHGFRFPDHAHEDAPVTVAAHVLAGAVDVLAGPVYFWRDRDDGPPSITQRPREPANLDGRMRQICAVAGFLARHEPSLRLVYDVAVLEHDLMIMLTELPHLTKAYREKILIFGRAFLAAAHPRAMSELPDDLAGGYRLISRPDALMRWLNIRRPAPFL